MAHDKNGGQLRVGDIVIIHCKVKAVLGDTDEYNNVNLETIEEHFPSNSYSIIILNSKQTEKVSNAIQESREGPIRVSVREEVDK